MLSILRKARLKDKEMRILMLYDCWTPQEALRLLEAWKRTGQCRQNDNSQENHERGRSFRESHPRVHHQNHRLPRVSITFIAAASQADYEKVQTQYL